jgi:hypothetical protein
MLEIAELNSETGNNSARLVVVALTISVARLAAAALAVLIAATPFKLATFAVLVIVAPLKRGACKAARGRVASSAS